MRNAQNREPCIINGGNFNRRFRLNYRKKMIIIIFFLFRRRYSKLELMIYISLHLRLQRLKSTGN